MNIEKIKFQYAKPKGKPSKTKGQSFIVESTWEEYFSAIFDKNYFTDDELEFLIALKLDLEQEIKEIDKSIKKLTKCPKN